MGISQIYDEQKLSRQLQQGSMEAFEAIYNHYKSRLYYFTLGYLGHHEETREIIQNVFISLWEHRLTIDPDLSLKSYLYKITTNLIYNYLKRSALHQKIIKQELQESIQEDDSTQKTLYYNDLKNTIDRIISQMPDQQRQIFKMSRWEGLSHEEIAKQLKLSVRTVENQVYRAIRLLKENLKDELFMVFLMVTYIMHTL